MTKKPTARRKRWAKSFGEKGINRVRVFEHVNGRMYLEWRVDGRLKTQPLKTDDKVVACERAEELAAELRAAAEGALTLGALFDNYLANVRPDQTNVESRKRTFKLMEQVWGRTRVVSTLTPVDVEQYIRARQAGTLTRNGPVRMRVIEEDLQGLRAALRLACVTRGANGRLLLRENPLPNLKIPREKNVRRARLGDGTYEAMLGVADAVDTTGRFKLALQVCYETGHRLNSVRQLAWPEVRFTSRSIWWAGSKQKNGEDHETIMSDALYDVLMAARRKAPDAQFVFQVVRGPARPLERESFYTWWHEARQQLGLPRGLGWHAFRRELASQLAHQPLGVVKELLGSKHPEELLRVYIKPTLRQQADVLKQRFGSTAVESMSNP